MFQWIVEFTIVTYYVIIMWNGFVYNAKFLNNLGLLGMKENNFFKKSQPVDHII